MNETQALDQFEPACHRYARQLMNVSGISNRWTRDDLLQIARTYVVRAVREYDPNKGMKLSTYIIQRIRWGLMEVTNNDYQRAVKVCSITTVKDGENWTEPSYDENFEDDPENFESLISSLNGDDRKLVVARIVHEKQWKAIGAMFGITLQAAQIRFAKILEQLKPLVQEAN